MASVSKNEVSVNLITGIKKGRGQGQAYVTFDYDGTTIENITKFMGQDWVNETLRDGFRLEGAALQFNGVDDPKAQEKVDNMDSARTGISETRNLERQAAAEMSAWLERAKVEGFTQEIAAGCMAAQAEHNRLAAIIKAHDEKQAEKKANG